MKRKSISIVTAIVLMLTLAMPMVFAAPKTETQTVTANLYLPGEYNKKMPGLTAYLNNPDNPLQATGMPNKPLEKNAKLNISNDGTMTLTLKLPNPVFTLQKLGTAKNAKVVSVKTSDELKGLGPKKVIHDSRISELTIKLLDKSGEYVFEGSTVYPTMFSKDISDVPLYLKVEFNKEQATEKETKPVIREEIKEENVTENESQNVEETVTTIDETEAQENLGENIEETTTEITTESEQEEIKNSNVAIIISCVVAVVAIAAIIAVVVIKKKKA